MSRGGYRANAKRPLKFGEKSVRITIQVPESKVNEVKKKIKRMLSMYIKKPLNETNTT